ncbi:hypothetical protein M378DRAFT_20011 [Amanita muscaria Koide BX008]|uniref:Uncharacterized protein n=1 Tax=Amanita muscaria (strain Koide BX008) TaxID=946122 RepID=A0A0C2T6X3_AMAMK|nr:hypothetical protein M378DRAFT_20011 [Amanita muscaria Koide BX008]
MGHEPPYSTHPHTSNHHELTLIGLVDACERITLTRGHQFLLARNLSALLTITSPSLGRNRHYARTFDRLLKGWFLEDPSNTITLGWYPKEYNPEALKHLPNWTRAQRVTTNCPPASPSAATLLRVAKATMTKTIRVRNARRKLGKHFPQLGPGPSAKQAKPHLRFINFTRNDPRLLTRLTRALTAHAPIGRYYLHRPWHNRHIWCRCPGEYVQTVNHVLDDCTLYARHWEGWYLIPLEKEAPLKALVSFLRSNPTSFTFVDAPALKTAPLDLLLRTTTYSLRSLQLNDPTGVAPNVSDLV